MRNLQCQPFVIADRYRLFGIKSNSQQAEQRFTGWLFFGVGFLHQLHGKNVFAFCILVGMRLHGSGIRRQVHNQFFAALNLLRESHGDFVFKVIDLAVVGSFQRFQPGQLNIKIHFLFNQRIARRQCLDFGIGQCRLVHVITASSRAFARHNLPDEFLLIFNKLPTVSVKRTLGDITENVDFFIFIALPQNTALALLNVRWPPRYIKVVQRNQALLDIGASTHFGRAAH